MSAPVARLTHLIARFFGFVRARGPGPFEQRWVAAELDGPVAALFWAQRPEDQRHAIEVARRVGDDPELVEAALLHDVGKVQAPLGAVARSLATVLGSLGLPMPGSWRRYRDHGTLGAAALEAVGASPLAVAFARHHPGAAPKGIDPSRWARLAAADENGVVAPERSHR